MEIIPEQCFAITLTNHSVQAQILHFTDAQPQFRPDWALSGTCRYAIHTCRTIYRSVPQIRHPSRISPPPPAFFAQSLAKVFLSCAQAPHLRRRLILIPQSKYYLSHSAVYRSSVYSEHGPPASTMDTPATSRKRPASLLLNAKAGQPTASVVSISLPHARRHLALGPHPTPTMTS